MKLQNEKSNVTLPHNPPKSIFSEKYFNKNYRSNILVPRLFFMKNP